jgi:hypothetical protein
VQQLEKELEKLSTAELQQVRDWLDDFVEDRMQFAPQFERAVQESENEMNSGLRPRVRQP